MLSCARHTGATALPSCWQCTPQRTSAVGPVPADDLLCPQAAVSLTVLMCLGGHINPAVTAATMVRCGCLCAASHGRHTNNSLTAAQLLGSMSAHRHTQARTSTRPPSLTALCASQVTGHIGLIKGLLYIICQLTGAPSLLSPT